MSDVEDIDPIGAFQGMPIAGATISVHESPIDRPVLHGDRLVLLMQVQIDRVNFPFLRGTDKMLVQKHVAKVIESAVLDGDDRLTAIEFLAGKNPQLSFDYEADDEDVA